MPAIASPVVNKIMLEEYRIPSITGYNRLEPVPRSKDPDNSLKADVRDALWMLTRQWQYGEFKGEDAGSPVTALILGEHTPVDRLRLGNGDPRAYDPSQPLEATVEAEKLGDSLFFALQIARYFIRLLKKKSLDTVYTDKFITAYPLSFVIDPNDQDGLQLNLSVQSKLFNGCTLMSDITTPQGSSTKFDNWLQSQGFPSGDQTSLLGLATDLTDWYNRNYFQPANGAVNTAWQSAQLEYQFSMASPPESPAQKFLSADQFYGGHLDWYSFDLNSSQTMALKPEPSTPPPVLENLVSFIPAPVSFKGMPSPRYWTMEDGQLDFGKIDASPTGLLHLLMAEFALVYGNDWFMLPYPLKVNTICEIKGLVVTDVFGDNTLVSPAGSGSESNWQRWALFHQADISAQAAANRTTNHLFYLSPSITQSLQDNPLEEVNFLRDEIAEMVWAVENRVPSQAGKGVSGNAMALKNTEPAAFVPAPGNAAIRYILGTTVPDNWIPFIPVHISGSDTEIRFQRAAMPGAKGALGEIISETPAPYYVNEEEIPRAGILVSRNFSRTRWLNGKTFLWIGRTKDAGTGEGWSNLKFDQIVPIQQPDKA
jgi:hypothetical protein